MFTDEVTVPGTETDKSDPILDQLLFLAQYFGRAQNAEQLIGGLPLVDGRLGESNLEECASRAGLAVTPLTTSADSIKSTMLPALVIGADGEAYTVISRKGKKVEIKAHGVDGATWVELNTLTRSETANNWYLIRPVFHFDERSLLYNLPNPTRWFWDTLKANRWIYGWALLATIIINLFGAAIPFFTMAVYDRVVPNNAIDSLWVLATAAVAVILFDLFSKITRSYLVDSAARKADLNLSSQIFAKSLKIRAINRPASGGVLANIVRDFESIRDFFTSSSLTLLGDLPFMFFFLGIIALIGGPLVYVPLVLIPIALGVSLLLRRPLARVLDENSQENSQRTAHLFEVMNGLDTVKCLGLEAWARRKWEMLTVTMSGNNMKMREISSFGNYFSAMLTSLTTVSIVSFGALLIAKGELTMGQLIAVSMLSARAIAPVSQLSGLIVRWQQTKIALHALNQVMSAPTDEKSGNLLYLPKIKGRIELRDLKFSYPESLPTLKGINLTINPGEKVAFIGRIGSGKSTLIKILLNLYEPDEGVALIDGVATQQIDPNSLRRAIGYVPQDVVLFHGDIRENIVAGASDVAVDDLLQAIKTACLEDSLAQMPAGISTPVGERGERLSGGQRQSVAIARALIRKPKLMLIDEPSSMMDPATENKLIKNMRDDLADTTVLLVTHRMAMLPMVDRLVVFNNGQIVADGPRDEVLRRLGASVEDNMMGSKKLRERSRKAAQDSEISATDLEAQAGDVQEDMKIEQAIPTLTNEVPRHNASSAVTETDAGEHEKPPRPILPVAKKVQGFRPGEAGTVASANDEFSVSETVKLDENHRFAPPEQRAPEQSRTTARNPNRFISNPSQTETADEVTDSIEGGVDSTQAEAIKAQRKEQEKKHKMALAQQVIARMRAERKALQETQFIEKERVAQIVGSGK